MSDEVASTADPVGMLVARLASSTDGRPGLFVVGIDGRSGAGKSTLAAEVAARLGNPVVVIEGDEFYAGGSAATWDRRTVVGRSESGIDWRRQRQVLDDLRQRGEATWHPFDWDAPTWDADEVPLRAEPIRTVAGPGTIVILEGAYSCRPQLHGHLDLRVLLLAPAQLRRHRLVQRDGEDYHDDWAARWTGAEDHYFSAVMPPSRFDLVVGSET